MADTKQQPEQRTLWRAKLNVALKYGRNQEFLFREGEDVIKATRTAQRLLDSSPAAEMARAEIIGVERAGHLWN